MKSKLTLIFTLLVIAFSAVSCQEPIDCYKGSIVLEKQGEKPCGHKIIVQKTNFYPNGRKEIISRIVYVYQYDYDRFDGIYLPYAVTHWTEISDPDK